MVNELKKNVRVVVAAIYRDIKELMDDAEKNGGYFDAGELGARQADHWAKLDAHFDNFSERHSTKKKGFFGGK